MIEYYDEISYYLLKLTGDKTLAKDLTQETYTKVLELNGNNTTNIPKAYLYRTAQNLVIDKARKEKGLIQTTYEDEEHSSCEKESTEWIIYNEKEQKRLKDSIRKLPTQMKKTFILHYYKGFSRKEIASIMNITVNAAGKNITRATLKIKEDMQKEYQ